MDIFSRPSITRIPIRYPTSHYRALLYDVPPEQTTLLVVGLLTDHGLVTYDQLQSPVQGNKLWLFDWGGPCVSADTRG